MKRIKKLLIICALGSYIVVMHIRPLLSEEYKYLPCTELKQSVKGTSFDKMSDFKLTDKSNMIGFPEFKGNLPFKFSKFKWHSDAKIFAQKSMSVIPPAVREAKKVQAAYVISCDVIAREKHSNIITVPIVAEALSELAKCCGMPDHVIQNLPKNMSGLEKQKIALNPMQLKPQYRPK